MCVIYSGSMFLFWILFPSNSWNQHQEEAARAAAAEAEAEQRRKEDEAKAEDHGIPWVLTWKMVRL